jgi:hypothetical protein
MTSSTRRLVLGGLLTTAVPGVAVAQRREFAVGQEWDVPDLPEGHAIIGLVGELNGVRVIHASVSHNGLTEFGQAPDSGITHGHLALTEAAFAASVSRLEDANAFIPELFQIDYDRWQAAPLVINAPIAEVVRYMYSAALRRTL